MKNHSKAQSMKLHVYFTKILGYGNKCQKCHVQGQITVINKNSVSFHCLRCKLNWTFETKEKVGDLILKTFGFNTNITPPKRVTL